jgi:hypothetical protein
MINMLSQSIRITDHINTAGILDGLMDRVKSVVISVLLMDRNFIAVR